MASGQLTKASDISVTPPLPPPFPSPPYLRRTWRAAPPPCPLKPPKLRDPQSTIGDRRDGRRWATWGQLYFTSTYDLRTYTRTPLRGRLTPSATFAKGRTQSKMKEVERRGPSLGATSDLIMPRATCAELIALCCAVCLLSMSRSDRQYGCNLRKETHEEDREGTNYEESKNTST